MSIKNFSLIFVNDIDVWIKQGMTTVGGCRYRGAIPVGLGGRLDIDANYGIRKAFLPQVQI